MAPKKKSTKENTEQDANAEAKTEETKVEQNGNGAAAEKKEVEAKAPAATEPEKPKEGEADAPADSRSKVAAKVAVNLADSTLNVLPTAGGKLLTSLSEGGFQHLLAATRGNVGMKAGRYMFEVRIAETIHSAERGHAQPRICRVGFSLAGSSLFLDEAGGVSFDSEGFFAQGTKRTKSAQKFGANQTVAVLLNLDASSPNANTISLFKDGLRVSEPQALPEELRGKVLFPTIVYRNVSLQVNFGPSARAALPFACRMLGDAAQEDVESSKLQATEGKPEVVFPVGMPSQGYFDWVDQFLEENPSYVELSDRKILEWARKSGCTQAHGAKHASNDKPDVKLGLPSMDDGSVRRVLSSVAPLLGRNFVVPELRANLVAAERQAALRNFAPSEFKRTVKVIMGEPNKKYKARVQSALLAQKTAKADAVKKVKAQEAERKRMQEERKRKLEEAKNKGGKADEEEKEEPVAEASVEDNAPVELTEEEKQLWYRNSATRDIGEQALTRSFAKFSLPTKSEGFDDITFVWQKEPACAKMLKDWMLEHKLTQRVEDLQAGDWFKEEWSKWQKQLQEWRKRQGEWTDPAKRKVHLQKRKEAAKKKCEEEGKGEEPAADMEINADDVDVLGVADVADLGSGEPLFARFAHEDWALLSARFEIHLLLHAFKKDLNDPDRTSFGGAHLPFYHNMYFKKNFSLNNFGVHKTADFVKLIKEVVKLDGDDTSLLQPLLSSEAPQPDFVKFTEEHRRERQRREEAGDETAQLKFPRGASQAHGNVGKSPAWSGQQKRPATMPAFAQQKRPAYGRW